MMGEKAFVNGDQCNEEKKRKRGLEEEVNGGGGNDVLDLLDGSLNCSFCMQLPERPVTVRFDSSFFVVIFLFSFFV